LLRSLFSATRMVSAASNWRNGSAEFRLFSQREQALLELGKLLFGLTGRITAIQVSSGITSQKRLPRRRKGIEKCVPSTGWPEKGVAVDDPDEKNRDDESRNGDERSALRDRQEAQALFQPLKEPFSWSRAFKRPPSPPKDIGSRILIQLSRLSGPVAKRSAKGSRGGLGVGGGTAAAGVSGPSPVFFHRPASLAG